MWLGTVLTRKMIRVKINGVLDEGHVGPRARSATPASYSKPIVSTNNPRLDDLH